METAILKKSTDGLSVKLICGYICTLAYTVLVFCFTQVNYLSSLFFTLELLPNILEAAASTSSADARIIFVSSNSHRFVSWDPDNFSPVEEGYQRLTTYALTKMYNVSIYLSIMDCSLIPRPIPRFSMFQHATLKSWEWAWGRG